jgi:hypothetical protein
MDAAAVQAAIQAAVQAAEANFQAQLQQTQQQLQAAQQQLQAIQVGAAVPPVVPVVAPAVPPPVVFAHSPATTGAAAAFIDYNSANGAKIQKAAVEKLHVEHDLDRNSLHDFLESLRSRAIACGW